ncbi:MAG: hypothetical protein ACRYGR_07150 [Janthinobacterium lividum]
MSSHFVVTNKGDQPIHVQAMSHDKDGRFTHAYLIQVDGGHSKSFSSQLPTSFMVHELPPTQGVLLPRGVPPANVEKPHDVPVDPAASAEVARVADVAEEPAA